MEAKKKRVSKGYSLHIGLNSVDPSQYPGLEPIPHAEKEAKEMKKIADSQCFSSTLLLTTHATRRRVHDEIEKVAKKMTRDDIFLVTYSGHGSRIRDPKNRARFVDAWDLYDGYFKGDRLYKLWGKFPAGARILVIPDCCYSGTDALVITAEGGTPECLDKKSRRKSCQQATPSSPWAAKFKASVLLISACQDNQQAGNDVFTPKLRDVWDKGKFQGDYWCFYESILYGMDPTQTPNILLMGADYQLNRTFVQQRPFQI